MGRDQKLAALTIGEAARLADVTVSTLRYYERRDLLPEPRRCDRGYRRYEAADVQRIGFIRKAQDLGFTLKEIGELLDLRRNRSGSCASGSCASASQYAARRRRATEQRIAHLTKIRNALSGMLRSCRSATATDHCPFLSALEP